MNYNHSRPTSRVSRLSTLLLRKPLDIIATSPMTRYALSYCPPFDSRIPIVHRKNVRRQRSTEIQTPLVIREDAFTHSPSSETALVPLSRDDDEQKIHIFRNNARMSRRDSDCSRFCCTLSSLSPTFCIMNSQCHLTEYPRRSRTEDLAPGNATLNSTSITVAGTASFKGSSPPSAFVYDSAHNIPPADRGVRAWTFCAAAFMIEFLFWGPQVRQYIRWN